MEKREVQIKIIAPHNSGKTTIASLIYQTLIDNGFTTEIKDIDIEMKGTTIIKRCLDNLVRYRSTYINKFKIAIEVITIKL